MFIPQLESRRCRRAALLACVVACLAFAWSNAADRWPDEREAGPFILHADFSLREHDNLITEMAALQRDLLRTLGIGESSEKIHLFLFSRKTTYQAYLRQYFPSVPYRRALFIKRRGPGMVFAYINPDFEVDVRHESTHALLHADLTHVPLWLDEGLAEYFEVPPDDRGFDNPHLPALKRELFFGIVPNIEKLENVETLEKMGATQYRQSWSWVHFMLHGPPEAHDELVRYFDDIKNAVPSGKLSERLRRRIPDLDDQFAQHFKTWKR